MDSPLVVAIESDRTVVESSGQPIKDAYRVLLERPTASNLRELVARIELTGVQPYQEDLQYGFEKYLELHNFTLAIMGANPEIWNEIKELTQYQPRMGDRTLVVAGQRLINGDNFHSIAMLKEITDQMPDLGETERKEKSNKLLKEGEICLLGNMHALYPHELDSALAQQALINSWSASEYRGSDSPENVYKRLESMGQPPLNNTAQTIYCTLHQRGSYVQFFKFKKLSKIEPEIPQAKIVKGVQACIDKLLAENGYSLSMRDYDEQYKPLVEASGIGPSDATMQKLYMHKARTGDLKGIQSWRERTQIEPSENVYAVIRKVAAGPNTD